MGVLNDIATWVESLYGLESDDLVKADDIAENDMGGKANLQPLQLGKRTRYLKNLLSPIAAAISNDVLVRLLLEHGVDIDLKAPLIKLLGTSGGTFATADTNPTTGSLAMAHPIIGATGSPYAVHGSTDLDLGIAFGVFPRPCPKEVGIVRLIDSGAAGVLASQEASPPAAPSSWARAYTKTVINTTNMVCFWTQSVGGTKLDTQLPGETVTYLRGPGAADWYRISPTTLNGSQLVAGNVAVSSTSYVSVSSLAIPGVRVGDTLDVSFGGEHDGSGSTNYDVSCQLLYPGMGMGLGISPFYGLTNNSRQYGGRIVATVLSTPGTFTMQVTAKKATGGDTTTQFRRNWITWTKTR